MVKLSWKEILVILVLAVLATATSVIYKETLFFCDCPNIPPGVFVDCFCSERGWPFYFISYIGGFSPLRFVIDLLFYFILILVGWVILKTIFKRAKS